ncbi:unnamed protein product, partial [Rangifer tarandus platyrhynchus]
AQPAEDGLRPLEDPVGPACRPSRDSPVQTRSREKRQAARRGARPARPFQHAQPASGPNERWQRPLCQREGPSDQEEKQEAAAISGAVAPPGKRRGLQCARGHSVHLDGAEGPSSRRLALMASDWRGWGA